MPYQNPQPANMLMTARTISGQTMIGSLSWAWATGFGS